MNTNFCIFQITLISLGFETKAKIVDTALFRIWQLYCCFHSFTDLCFHKYVCIIDKWLCMLLVVWANTKIFHKILPLMAEGEAQQPHRNHLESHLQAYFNVLSPQVLVPRFGYNSVINIFFQKKQSSVFF